MAEVMDSKIRNPCPLAGIAKSRLKPTQMPARGRRKHPGRRGVVLFSPLAQFKQGSQRVSVKRNRPTLGSLCMDSIKKEKGAAKIDPLPFKPEQLTPTTARINCQDNKAGEERGSSVEPGRLNQPDGLVTSKPADAGFSLRNAERPKRIRDIELELERSEVNRGRGKA